MQQLRQLISALFLVALLGGCSEIRRWSPERCPTSTPHTQLPPSQQIAEPGLEPIPPIGQPVTYKLDNQRTLEIWDAPSNGHYTFLNDGKKVRTEPILYCSAEPLFPNDESIPESPAVCLTRSRARFVVIRQQDHNPDHFLHKIYKVAAGFPKVCEFKSNSPLTLTEVGSAYRFVGEDCLPGFGACQCVQQVIFKYSKGKLKIDRESMRKKLLTPDKLREAKREIRRNFKTPNDIPPELFDIVFAFFYCGEVAKAKRFFNSVYPPHQEQRAYWWNFVEEQMSQSAWHKLIEQ